MLVGEVIGRGSSSVIYKAGDFLLMPMLMLLLVLVLLLVIVLLLLILSPSPSPSPSSSARRLLNSLHSPARAVWSGRPVALKHLDKHGMEPNNSSSDALIKEFTSGPAPFDPARLPAFGLLPPPTSDISYYALGLLPPPAKNRPHLRLWLPTVQHMYR